MEAKITNDSIDLATWNRPRSSDELREFVDRHHDLLPEDVEL